MKRVNLLVFEQWIICYFLIQNQCSEPFVQRQTMTLKCQFTSHDGVLLRRCTVRETVRSSHDPLWSHNWPSAPVVSFHVFVVDADLPGPGSWLSGHASNDPGVSRSDTTLDRTWKIVVYSFFRWRWTELLAGGDCVMWEFSAVWADTQLNP